jgi:hypothetical protein
MSYIESYEETAKPATADDTSKYYLEVRTGGGSILVYDAEDTVLGYRSVIDSMTMVETVTLYIVDAAAGGKVRESFYRRHWYFGEPQWRIRDGRGYVPSSINKTTPWKNIPKISAISGLTNVTKAKPWSPLTEEIDKLTNKNFGPKVKVDAVPAPSPGPKPAPIPHPLPLPPPTPPAKKPPAAKKPGNPIKGNPGIIEGFGPGPWGPDHRYGPGHGPAGGLDGHSGLGRGGPGLGGWMSDLSGGRGFWSTTSGGKQVGYTPSVSTPSASSGRGATSNPGLGDRPDRDKGGTATAGVDASSGGVHTGGMQTSTGNRDSGSSGGSSGRRSGEQGQSANSPTRPKLRIGAGNVSGVRAEGDPDPETPNPETNSTRRRWGLDAFGDGISMNALESAGAFLSPPSGPVHVFTPDAGDASDGYDAAAIDWELFDPVAPYASGDYEPRRRGPRSSARPGRIRHPGVLALYPEGGSGGGRDEDDETIATVERLTGPVNVPEIPSEDPAAAPAGGVVRAVSNGVAFTTMNNFVASGMSDAPRTRNR